MPSGASAALELKVPQHPSLAVVARHRSGLKTCTRIRVRFVDEYVVVTEKLDGGNTLLHAGKVYARSVSTPSGDKWMAMVQEAPRLESN